MVSSRWISWVYSWKKVPPNLVFSVKKKTNSEPYNYRSRFINRSERQLPTQKKDEGDPRQTKAKIPNLTSEEKGGAREEKRVESVETSAMTSEKIAAVLLVSDAFYKRLDEIPEDTQTGQDEGKGQVLPRGGTNRVSCGEKKWEGMIDVFQHT